MIRRLLVVLGLSATLAGLAGCGGGPAAVNGTIKYEGESLKWGTIAFIPVGEGKKFGGPIEDGKYAIAAEFAGLPGEYTVQIRWSKPTGKKVFNGDLQQNMDVLAEGLPDKYHDKSELKTTLTSGPNEKNFDLKK